MCDNRSMAQCFYGSVTVGERGQIVIPAEARADLGIKPGDKVLVMRHPTLNGLMVTTLEEFKEFLDRFGAMAREAMEQVEVEK